MTNQERINILHDSGVSINQIAEETGYSQPYISNIKAGRKKGNTNVTVALQHMLFDNNIKKLESSSPNIEKIEKDERNIVRILALVGSFMMVVVLLAIFLT